MMRHRLLPLVIVVTAACVPELEPERDASARMGQPPAFDAERTGGTCPGADFPTFLEAFAEDTVIQREWTTFPLENSYVVPGDPEPVTRSETVSLSEAEFPLIPSASERALEGRDMTIEEAAGGVKRVSVFRRDTDWLVRFTFRPAGSCWRLARIEDWSL